MQPTNPTQTAGIQPQTPMGTTPGYNGVLSPAMALATVWDINLVDPRLKNQEQYDAMYAWNQSPETWPLFVFKGAPYQNGVEMSRDARSTFCDNLRAKGYTIDQEIYYEGNDPLMTMVDRAARGEMGVPPGDGSSMPSGGVIPPAATSLPLPAGYIPVSLVMPTMPDFPAAALVQPPVPPIGDQPIGAYNPVYGAGVAPHYIGGFFKLAEAIDQTRYQLNATFTPLNPIMVPNIAAPLTGTWTKTEEFMGMVDGWIKTA